MYFVLERQNEGQFFSQSQLNCGCMEEGQSLLIMITCPLLPAWPKAAANLTGAITG